MWPMPDPRDALAVIARSGREMARARLLLAARPDQVEVTPFFSLVLAWNRGISFGLFLTARRPMLSSLSALAIVIAIGLTMWLSRIEQRWAARASGW